MKTSMYAYFSVISSKFVLPTTTEFEFNLHTGIEYTDHALIIQIREGDLQAFKLLYDKYGLKVYQFSRKYLHDKQDAEDVLNEVFLKVWENRRSLKTDTSFQSYLFTVAYNNMRKRWLKKSREESYIRVFAREYLQEMTGNEEQLDYQLFVKKLNRLSEQLPARRREIFVMRYQQELKNTEIAGRLHLTEQFVKNQLSIARKFIISGMTSDQEIAELLLFFMFLH